MAKIVFLGDSLTASANVSLSERWAQKVGLANGYAPTDIINAGVPGNTSADMRTRLQSDVLDKSPEVCVMMATVNDKTHGLTLAQHEANMRDILSQLQARGIKTVIVSPPLYRSGVDSWREWVEKDQALAGEFGLPYVDVWREFTFAYLYYPLAAFEALYSDGMIHQTAAGNSLIAAVATRATCAGVFLPDPPHSGECNELTASLADLQKGGATVARLDRVRAALSSI